MDRDEKPRLHPPRVPTKSPQRGPSSDEPSAVLDLLLVDCTGPMKLSIWGFAVMHFLASMENVDTKRVLLRFAVMHFLASMENVDTKRVLLRFDPMRKAYHSNNAGSGPS